MKLLDIESVATLTHGAEFWASAFAHLSSLRPEHQQLTFEIIRSKYLHVEPDLDTTESAFVTDLLTIPPLNEEGFTLGEVRYILGDTGITSADLKSHSFKQDRHYYITEAITGIRVCANSVVEILLSTLVEVEEALPLSERFLKLLSTSTHKSSEYIIGDGEDPMHVHMSEREVLLFEFSSDLKIKRVAPQEESHE